MENKALFVPLIHPHKVQYKLSNTTHTNGSISGYSYSAIHHYQNFHKTQAFGDFQMVTNFRTGMGGIS